MTTNTERSLTAAQIAVLAVVDAHGASGVGTRTRDNMNVVHAGAARALVRAGVLTEFAGPDGPMVRRAADKSDPDGTHEPTQQQPASPAVQYSAGDRVYRWWDSGALGVSLQPLTVVRANRKTYTVRTDQGSVFRLPHADVVGRYEDDDESAAPAPLDPDSARGREVAAGLTAVLGEVHARLGREGRSVPSVSSLRASSAGRPSAVAAVFSAAPSAPQERPLAARPANVRVTEWLAARPGVRVSVAAVARGAGCSRVEAERMCMRLSAAGLLVFGLRVRTGGGSVMFWPPEPGTSVVVR